MTSSTPEPQVQPAKASQAELLKKVRAERNLTQEKLAELTGLARGTVADVERGVAHLARVSTIRRVAERLGISADDLMAGVP